MNLLRRIIRAMSKWQMAVDELIKESGVTVRRWRNTNSGRAYCGAADWGIEIPVPKGPISFSIGAHEIGHQILHRTGHRPRWVEEVEAWEYALTQFERFDLRGHERVVVKVVKSLNHSFNKAISRGVSPEVINNRFPIWVDRIAQTTVGETK